MTGKIQSFLSLCNKSGYLLKHNTRLWKVGYCANSGIDSLQFLFGTGCHYNCKKMHSIFIMNRLSTNSSWLPTLTLIFRHYFDRQIFYRKFQPKLKHGQCYDQLIPSSQGLLTLLWDESARKRG